MNIIQLFSLLDLKRDQILEFGSDDYIRIEKKINFKKKINPEIDSNTSENLIFALKEYKEELLFILSNRIFFNILPIIIAVICAIIPFLVSKCS